MKADLPVQLSLAVTLCESAHFANYYTADNNRLAVHALNQFSTGTGDRNLLVWGRAGVGLTHLLQACCHSAGQRGLEARYLPLAELVSYTPEDVCEGLEAVPLVCLDDFDSVCGDPRWEQTLFHLYNRLRDRGHGLLLASHTSPANMALGLADLQSRVLGSVIFHLHPLTDADKVKALILRAKGRGMDMPEDVARYILTRAPRETAELFDLLNCLDEASLQQQRRLTIPFVKDVLAY